VDNNQHEDSSEWLTMTGQNQPETHVSTVRLFLAFLRLGLTAFGGPAMVAYIGDLAVKKKRWLSHETFRDGAALCQSIPGATAMQTAAYVGLRTGGPVGALAAFVGFGLPAFVLMIGLSALYQAGRDFQPVLAAFHGLRVIVIAIVVNAALNFGRSSIRNGRDTLLAAGAAAVLVCHGSPIIAIVASAALSVLLYRGVDLPTRAPSAGSRITGRQTFALAGALALLAVVGLVALYMWERPQFNLATLMLKVDLFAFGGGFASVPLMLHGVVDVHHWLDGRTFMDGIALGQVTPGPIVITATFVGYQVAGVLGALVGTVGIFTPSFLMVLVTVPYFDRLQQALWFRRAIRGVLASFVGLLIAVAANFGIAVSWSIPAEVLALAALVALRLRVDIFWVVLVGAAVSMLVL
jgi:chromate transporter